MEAVEGVAMEVELGVTEEVAANIQLSAFLSIRIGFGLHEVVEVTFCRLSSLAPSTSLAHTAPPSRLTRTSTASTPLRMVTFILVSKFLESLWHR